MRRCETGDVIVAVDPRYFRPAEVETCWATRPKRMRNWAETGNHRRMVEMVANDLRPRKTLTAEITVTRYIALES